MNTTQGAIGNVIRTPDLVAMAMGYSRSRVLCAAARLGVADAFAGGERSLQELADACRAAPDSLYRLLRALAVIGITAEVAPGRFVLTPLGEPLRKDVPNSVWPAVVFWADLLADSWSYLTDCIRTGQTSFQIMESAGVESRWSKDPEAGGIFRAVMGTAPAENYMPIVQNFDFTNHKVVADLGGGGGALLAAVLMSHSHLQGMLVDRSESIQAAAPRFAANGLESRCRLLAADLSESVPPGADVHLLKHVLHGYRDEKAIQILRNCRAALPPNGRLLVIEFVLPAIVSQPDPALEARLMSDINMLAVTGGKERSVAQWKELLGAVDFTIERVQPVPEMDVSIIEAIRNAQ